LPVIVFQYGWKGAAGLFTGITQANAIALWRAFHARRHGFPQSLAVSALFFPSICSNGTLIGSDARWFFRKLEAHNWMSALRKSLRVNFACSVRSPEPSPGFRSPPY
jgi:hypothetical protein